MRIVIDLQACQSTGSRNRGIGRYSLALAKAMVKNSNGHDFHILLSNAFPETIMTLRQCFEGLLSPENIHVWEMPQPVAELFSENAWRMKAAQLVREQVLADLCPDFVHVASLFEGSGDDVVSSIGLNGHYIPTAITLYDLIPLVYADQYLLAENQRTWYFRRLHVLKRADLLLAISESSRQEGLRYLNVDPAKIVNISSAVDQNFGSRAENGEQGISVCQRYGLNLPYVMYTGGVDLRKNIDGLIRAYATLPNDIRGKHQLAIVCSVHLEEKLRLQRLIKSLGLLETDVILTGFVPDEDLPTLYRCCKLFVFPSWHEGFGLPALEAMTCGVPVIAANSSSLPEVIGNEEALFDPHSSQAIADKIEQVLTQPKFASDLIGKGLLQSKMFSWDESAARAIKAIEDSWGQKNAERAWKVRPLPRRKLAYVSPLPPLHSGIADYSAELIPSLDDFYDITLIADQQSVTDPWIQANFVIRGVDWYIRHFDEFDRVIFHLGNSLAHAYMYALFDLRPGVIILHDFFLGDSLAYLDMNALIPGIWTRALYSSHGYPALLAQRDPASHPDLIKRLPCSLEVLRRAEGIIVHSSYSAELIKSSMGSLAASRVKVIPHLRNRPIVNDKLTARKLLSIVDDEILICSFGLLGPNKQNHRLLDACFVGELFQKYRIRLVFVGENDRGAYGNELQRLITDHESSEQVQITGFASKDLYRTYLQAADIAVQLRGTSRGESSGTIFDCLAYGIPLIANRNGSISELPTNVAQLLEDHFEQSQLIGAIELLCSSQHIRAALSLNAKAFMAVDRNSNEIAQQYFHNIEEIHATEPNAIFQRTLKALVAIETPTSEDDWCHVAKSIARNRVNREHRTLYIDVTLLAEGTFSYADKAKLMVSFERACKLLMETRFEFVLRVERDLVYARSWAYEFFGFLAPIGDDHSVDICEKDLYFSLFSNDELAMSNDQAHWTSRVRILNGGAHSGVSEIEQVEVVLQRLRSEVAEILALTSA